MLLSDLSDMIPCPRTRSSGCQCENLQRITEAEETVKAIAQLEHTVDDVQGAVRFEQKPGQPTIIKGIVKGLTPGKHGFHIHEFGDLSKGCESAGAHYNPDGVEHGSLEQGHVGDLGNIIADKSGTARFQIKAERVELSDVVGRAIVIHADEDDLGKGGDEESLKTGNAGERVGCGVIRLQQSVEEAYKRKVSDKHFDRNQLPQIRRNHLNDSPFSYKEGTISLDKIKPVQSQRVAGLDVKAQDVFLNNEDRPFILDKDNYLVNGHHRFDAAHMLGIKKVKAIKVNASIEDLMKHFNDTASDTEVMPENYFKTLLLKKLNELWGGGGVPDYKTMPKYKLKRAKKGKHKFFVPSNEPTPKGVSALENIKGSVEPNFEFEWEEAKRYPEFEKIGKDAWIKLAQTGKLVKINSARDINNTDAGAPESFYNLDKDKQQRTLQQVARGEVEPPIVARYSDGYKELIGGNTRLTAMMLRQGSATVWQFDVPDEILDENFADGKVKGKSRPGRVKKAGASCKGSVSSLRAKAKKYSGEKGKMYHWCANMKGGKKKS